MVLVILFLLFLVAAGILIITAKRDETVVKPPITIPMVPECMNGIVTRQQLEVLRKKVNSKRSKF